MWLQYAKGHPALISYHCVLSPLGGGGGSNFGPRGKKHQYQSWMEMITEQMKDLNAIKQLLHSNNFCLSLTHKHSHALSSRDRRLLLRSGLHDLTQPKAEEIPIFSSVYLQQSPCQHGKHRIYLHVSNRSITGVFFFLLFFICFGEHC